MLEFSVLDHFLVHVLRLVSWSLMKALPYVLTWYVVCFVENEHILSHERPSLPPLFRGERSCTPHRETR